MRLLDMIYAILVAAIWGANFVAARYGVGHFPPFFLTGLRFSLVAALLIPFVARPNRQQLVRIAQLATVLGVLHFSLLFGGLYWGLDIPSCAIVAQLGVPFACLLGAMLYKDRLGKWRLSGMLIAFLGMIIVAGTPNVLTHPLGFSIAMLGAFCWALANIQIKRIEGVSIFQMLAWMALFAVPQLFLISYALERDQWDLLRSTPLIVVAAISYTAVCSTIVAYGLWYRLIKTYSISQVAPFSLLSPIFGIAFGQLFFTETLTWQVLLGGAVTIAGVAILVVRRPKLVELAETV